MGNRPQGRALGISISERSGSLSAAVAETSLDRASGKIKVHKMWLAVDGGLVVQSDMAKAKVESDIVYGLSSVLHERVTMKDGVVQQSNFHDYHVMRMSDMPEVMEVAFVDQRISPPHRQAAEAHAVYPGASPGGAESLRDPLRN